MTSGSSSPAGASIAAVALSRSTIRCEPSMMSSRCSSQPRATPSSTLRQLGICWRGSGGK
jgi:hypothetical protein